MQIEKHISDLLYRYQCVTVPGFGAFLTETVSAHVTGSASSFFPPKKVVSFNANVKNNDGLLANHVALQEKMSYELAVIKINDVVTEWIYLLQNRNRLALKNIGEISVNNEMNWVFEPANTINYFRTGSGSMTNINTSFATLPSHSAFLPNSAANFFSNEGNLAMTNFPFWLSGTYHWGIKGHNYRWEVDDFNNSASWNTHHQIWIR